MPESYHHALPAGTRIETFEITAVLGVGGFGITYRGYDHSLHRDVAIKEYLPNDLALRTADGTTVIPKSDSDRQSYEYGLKRFLTEARTLAQFNEPSIIRVSRFLESNGTAYLVMDYEEGQSLAEYLRYEPVLSEEKIKAIIVPILKSLQSVHDKNYLHRDIKPANIYLRRNGPPVLLDFGSARLALGGQTRTITGMVTPGYAPFEQYHSRTKQGPWTDLYALGATMYRCLAGKQPVDATERVAAINEGDHDPLTPAAVAKHQNYSDGFLAVVDWMLSVNPKERPQHVREVLERLTVDAPQDEATLLLNQGDDGAQKTVLLDTSSGDGEALYPPDGDITDEVKAARLTLRVADQGNVTAQLKMGLMYARGRGVEKDPARAAEWFRRAADQGNMIAQVKLAVMSAYGIGVPKDEAEAARWFRSAASQGHSGAQFNLGLMHAYGWGVDKDLEEATQWYRKAAEQGHGGAQLNLKLMRLQATRGRRPRWLPWLWASLGVAVVLVGTLALWWYLH